jgi:hypothetical protein
VFLVIDKINKRNQFVDNVTHDEMHECKFHGKVLLFEELLDGELVWSGKYGANIVCEGLQSIIMTLKKKSSDEFDELKFIFPEQNLTDIKMFLMDFKCESRSIDTPYTADVLEQCILVKDSVDLACDSFKVQCKLCPKKYVKKKMRNHIGYHIIHGDCSPNSHRCVYCGEIGCQISLVVTSGCGKRVVYGPKSDCNYFTEISKRLDNRFVKSYPCSNRPVLCEQCQSYYWSYNLDVHYKQLHVGIQCPEQISQEERVFIISSKKM